MAETLATRTKLAVVQEVLEDEGGATLRLQGEGHARLSRAEANYAAAVLLARRSQERQHPLGISFGERHLVTELLRADNDVPSQVVEEEADHFAVFFLGHDGVFRLKRDQSDFSRILSLLRKAIRQKVRVWFLAQKPDLVLLDVQQASEGVLVSLRITVVVAPEHLVKRADEMLRTKLRGSKAVLRDIRAVAKAYIDEADELNRAVREVSTKAARIQLNKTIALFRNGGRDGLIKRLQAIAKTGPLTSAWYSESRVVGDPQTGIDLWLSGRYTIRE